MKLVLLGAPGAGKGTQATRIKDEYSIPHISTGDILRAEIKKGTPLGILAKSLIDNGSFVPDDVIINIVKERLFQSDAEKGYILDGFPRTVNQAEKLAEFSSVDAVLNIEVDRDILLNRLTGRRVCPSCGESYHIDLLDGKNTCSKCGSDLIQRNDDTEEVISKRLKIYQELTKPLIEYYKEKNLLITVDGSKNYAEVFKEVKDILGEL